MKKNILYIFADEWRKQAVGCMKQDPVITPKIDEFASQSCHFINAVSTFAVCSPARASILTGKYPYECGMFTNCKTGLERIPMLYPQETLISDVCFANGYQTAYIGKWHLDACEQSFTPHPDSGAVGWDGYIPPGERRHHFEFWHAYNAMNHHMAPHYWEDDKKQITINQWSVAHETEVALEYLKRRDKTRPFCMYVSYNPPHPPFDQVPEKYLDLYKDQELEFRENVPENLRSDPEFIKKCKQYFAAVSGIDENFGRIISYLKESGLWDSTIVVLSADHGEYLGSHGRFGKSLWHEESIGIPLYFAGAGIVPKECEEPIGSVDQMPTILSYAGIKIPEQVSGVDFSKVLTASAFQANQLKIKNEAYLTMNVGLPEEHDEYHKYGLDPDCFGWRGFRTRTETYVVNNGWHPKQKQERLLYDLVKDPYQENPRVLTREEAKEQDAILEGYLKKTKDPFLLYPVE